MAESMNEILNPANAAPRDPEFPYAPEDWTKDSAEATAREEGISLADEHWEVVKALQEYFWKNDSPNLRELHDALEEKFHTRGGIKHTYGLFPGGPVAQGCRIAGLTPPPGSVDKSFGSVV